MLKSSIPEQYRQKAPLLYKDSVIYRILVLSALMSLTTFCVALVYYVAILEPSPTTNLYDCGGGTCKDRYESLSGCQWPAFYSGSFQFTTVDEGGNPHDGDFEAGHVGDAHNDDGNFEGGYHEDAENENHMVNENDPFGDAHQPWAGGRRILQEDSDCEPQGGNYWIIAGQHYGAGNSLENVLVQVSGYDFDIWSVVNLSWNAASMTWTLSSVIFSVLLGLGGDRFLDPAILQGGNDIETMWKETKDIELAEGTVLPSDNAGSPIPE